MAEKASGVSDRDGIKSPTHRLHQSRAAYIQLANLLGTITVVPALSLAEAKHVVEISFRRVLEKRGIRSSVRMWAA